MAEPANQVPSIPPPLIGQNGQNPDDQLYYQRPGKYDTFQPNPKNWNYAQYPRGRGRGKRGRGRGRNNNNNNNNNNNTDPSTQLAAVRDDNLNPSAVIDIKRIVREAFNDSNQPWYTNAPVGDPQNNNPAPQSAPQNQQQQNQRRGRSASRNRNNRSRSLSKGRQPSNDNGGDNVVANTSDGYTYRIAYGMNITDTDFMLCFRHNPNPKNGIYWTGNVPAYVREKMANFDVPKHQRVSYVLTTTDASGNNHYQHVLIAKGGSGQSYPRGAISVADTSKMFAHASKLLFGREEFEDLRYFSEDMFKFSKAITGHIKALYTEYKDKLPKDFNLKLTQSQYMELLELLVDGKWDDAILKSKIHVLFPPEVSMDLSKPANFESMIEKLLDKMDQRQRARDMSWDSLPLPDPVRPEENRGPRSLPTPTVHNTPKKQVAETTPKTVEAPARVESVRRPASDHPIQPPNHPAPDPPNFYEEVIQEPPKGQRSILKKRSGVIDLPDATVAEDNVCCPPSDKALGYNFHIPLTDGVSDACVIFKQPEGRYLGTGAIVQYWSADKLCNVIMTARHIYCAKHKGKNICHSVIVGVNSVYQEILYDDLEVVSDSSSSSPMKPDTMYQTDPVDVVFLHSPVLDDMVESGIIKPMPLGQYDPDKFNLCYSVSYNWENPSDVASCKVTQSLYFFDMDFTGNAETPAWHGRSGSVVYQEGHAVGVVSVVGRDPENKSAIDYSRVGVVYMGKHGWDGAIWHHKTGSKLQLCLLPEDDEVDVITDSDCCCADFKKYGTCSSTPAHPCSEYLNDAASCMSFDGKTLKPMKEVRQTGTLHRSNRMLFSVTFLTIMLLCLFNSCTAQFQTGNFEPILNPGADDRQYTLPMEDIKVLATLKIVGTQAFLIDMKPAGIGTTTEIWDCWSSKFIAWGLNNQPALCGIYDRNYKPNGFGSEQFLAHLQYVKQKFNDQIWYSANDMLTLFLPATIINSEPNITLASADDIIYIFRANYPHGPRSVDNASDPNYLNDTSGHSTQPILDTVFTTGSSPTTNLTSTPTTVQTFEIDETTKLTNPPVAWTTSFPLDSTTWAVVTRPNSIPPADTDDADTNSTVTTTLGITTDTTSPETTTSTTTLPSTTEQTTVPTTITVPRTDAPVTEPRTTVTTGIPTTVGTTTGSTSTLFTTSTTTLATTPVFTTTSTTS
ncbi:hypothetical protein, partial [Bradybaena similaris medionivirus]